MEKPKKPLTRSKTKKLIPPDKKFPCHEPEDIVEVQPPLGKKVMFNPKLLDKEWLGRHVTRSSARRQIHDEETRYEIHVQYVFEEVVEVKSPSEENDMTIKILER